MEPDERVLGSVLGYSPGVLRVGFWERAGQVLLVESKYCAFVASTVLTSERKRH